MKYRAEIFLVVALAAAGCTAGSAMHQADEPAGISLESNEHSSSEDEGDDADGVEPEESQEAQGLGEEETFEEPLYERNPDEQAEYDSSEIYNRVCVTCHGADGDGRGLEIELFSFGAPASEWTNGPSVDGILMTLEDGVHDSSMRAFPNFSDADRVALADYVLELRHALRDE